MKKVLFALFIAAVVSGTLYAYGVTKDAASAAPAGKKTADAPQAEEEAGEVEVGGITIVQSEGVTGSANAMRGGSSGGSGGSGGVSGVAGGGGSISECQKIGIGTKRGSCCAQITPSSAKPGCCTSGTAAYPSGAAGDKEMQNCCVLATKAGSQERITCCAKVNTRAPALYAGCLNSAVVATTQEQTNQR